MNLAATQDLRVVRVWPSIRDVLARGTRHADVRAAAALLVDDWLAAGGSRLDVNLDGKIDAAGAAVLDAAWGAARERCSRARARAELVPSSRSSIRDDAPLGPSGSSAYSGWWSYVDKDLRALLGRPVTGPFGTRFCGGGDVATCATSLWAALDAAAATLEASQGTDPPPGAPTRPRSGSVRAGHPPRTMRGTNKPTFQQAITFRDAPLGSGTRDDVRPPRSSSRRGRRRSRPRCLRALAEPVIHHRSPDFAAVFGRGAGTPARGLPHRERGARLHGLRHGRVRVGGRQPPLAGRARPRRLAGQVRRALAEAGDARSAATSSRSPTPGARRRARTTCAAHSPRAGRRRCSSSTPRRRRASSATSSRCSRRAPRRARSRRRCRLEPRRGAARDRRVGGRRRRHGLAEGAHVPAGPRVRRGLGARVGDARRRRRCRASTGTGRASGASRRRARRRSRPPTSTVVALVEALGLVLDGWARDRVRPPRRARSRVPRGRQGDGARALLARRRQRRRAHRRADARGDRRGRAAARPARPSRDHDRGRPRRPRRRGSSGSATSATSGSRTSPRRSPRSRRSSRAAGADVELGRRRRRRSRRSAPSRRLSEMKVLVREPIAEAGVELLRSRFDVDVDSDDAARGDHRRLRRHRDPLGDAD